MKLRKHNCMRRIKKSIMLVFTTDTSPHKRNYNFNIPIYFNIYLNNIFILFFRCLLQLYCTKLSSLAFNLKFVNSEKVNKLVTSWSLLLQALHRLEQIFSDL